MCSVILTWFTCDYLPTPFLPGDLFRVWLYEFRNCCSRPCARRSWRGADISRILPGEVNPVRRELTVFRVRLVLECHSPVYGCLRCLQYLGEDRQPGVADSYELVDVAGQTRTTAGEDTAIEDAPGTSAGGSGLIHGSGVDTPTV